MIPVLDSPISEEPLALIEVTETISKLKDGNADMLKSGDEPLAHGLHGVLAATW